jgi:hypothetical protein
MMLAGGWVGLNKIGLHGRPDRPYIQDATFMPQYG